MLTHSSIIYLSYINDVFLNMYSIFNYLTCSFYDIVNDVMDDIMNGSDDEEECNKIVNQVLDEIGIDTKSMVCIIY